MSFFNKLILYSFILLSQSFLHFITLYITCLYICHRWSINGPPTTQVVHDPRWAASGPLVAHIYIFLVKVKERYFHFFLLILICFLMKPKTIAEFVFV